MFFRVMDKSRLDDLVRGLAKQFEVVGPVAKGDAFVFGKIEDPSLLRLDYDTTILPPKKYFVPQSEEILNFRTADGSVTADSAEVASRVLLGVHPCDLNALMLMDNIFLGEFEDPYYKSRRENTLLIGVSCEPRQECFCNAWNTDEVHWGFDIFLTDLGDRFFVSVRSVKGAELLDRYVTTREIEPGDTADFQRKTREFKDSFSADLDTAQIPLLLDAKFDDPVWDELGQRCLSCGACSMVCPTCYCFDIKDRLTPDGTHGARVRVWDSCQFSEFAEVAHGHNFRESRASRVKYRYYHKQWGYLSKFERVLCVGCGRCQRACKADISPRVVIEALQGGASR
ncbi:MAG TPA: 4Fe-4S dicluster domain-containing protein [Coriobacteriia bacterium]|nr:4Fe-4S dicluster domain-containing protein [Coriobacteriia bacterium]